MKTITPCLWFDNAGRRGREVLRARSSRTPRSKRSRATAKPARSIHRKPVGFGDGASRSKSTARRSPPSTAARCSNSAKPFRSRSCATRRKKSTTTGKNAPAGGDDKGPGLRLAQGQIRRLLGSRSRSNSLNSSRESSQIEFLQLVKGPTAASHASHVQMKKLDINVAEKAAERSDDR